MSTVGVNVANTEFDAAQALLDLGNVREPSRGSYGEHHLSDAKESRESAKLFWSYLLASNVTKPPNKTTNGPKIGTVSPIFAVTKNNPKRHEETVTPPKRKTAEQEFQPEAAFKAESYNEQSTNKRSKIFKRKPMKHLPVTSSPLSEILSSPKVSNNINTNKVISQVKTRDVGTQTDDPYQFPIIKSMEVTITKLCEKIKTLEEQIKSNLQLSNSIDEDVSDDDHDFEDNDDESYKANSNDLDDSNFMDSDLDETFEDYETPKKGNKLKSKVRESPAINSTKILGNRNVNANGDDMVPIGMGNAAIPARVFRHINWNSYTSATRKLLTAVFSRRILATHSLTGKPSPAFPNKPAKKKLDQSLVNDIVQTVVERCSVPENVVRTSITTKCADESKMYRTREQNKKKRKINRENIPPDSESDDF